MPRFTFVAGSAFAAFFVFAAAIAAEDDNAALFNRLDSNHDGQITADEVPQERRGLFDRLLERADRNEDGKLSRNEFIAGLAGDEPNRIGDRPTSEPAPSGAKESNEKVRAYAAAIMKQYDANGDGVIDRNEWSKLNNLEKFDRNHDGKITLEEIIETISPSRTAVENAPGRVGGPEVGIGDRGIPGQGGLRGGRGPGGAAGAPGPFAALFRALDANRDNKLDAKEIAAASEVLKKLANSQGEITPQDLRLNSPGAGTGGRGGGFPNLPSGALLSEDAAFKSLDKNGDGKIQPAELPPRLQERFDTLDTNHDGSLDQSELQGVLPRLIRQLQSREGGKGENLQRRELPPERNRPEEK